MNAAKATASAPALGSAAAYVTHLPARRTDVPSESRDRAAAIVLAIGRMWRPEEIRSGQLGGDRRDDWEALKALYQENPAEAREALDMVDLLVEALGTPPVVESKRPGAERQGLRRRVRAWFEAGAAAA